MIDIEAALRSTLVETAEETSIPAFPGLDALRAAPARSLRRSFGVSAAVTCVALASGLGVAAAVVVGFVPTPISYDGFGDAHYAGEPAGPRAVPGTARTVLEGRGAQGDTLKLRIADSSGDGYCSQLSGMYGLTACEDPITTFGRVDKILTIFNTQSVGLGTTEFSATVPGAVTVRLSFDDGTSEPLAVAKDFTIGWFTDAQSLEHPELTGYDRSGAVIGRAALPTAEQKNLDCFPHC